MPRKRRSAEQARAEILEAGATALAARGPAALTLDEVAATVGVSRQAILHHFGSREGLMRAVVERAWRGLFDDLGRAGTTSPAALVDTVDDVARRKGHARVGAWLLLSDQGLPSEVFEGALAGLPADDDARYAMLLVGAALFGDAVFGARLRQALGLPDGEAARAGFRAWLARLLAVPERRAGA
jgi:TetR/AcrR family transcriptional regulator, repressor for neighboring sulfatase